MPAQHGRQLELAEMLAQQDRRRVGLGDHDAGVPSSAMQPEDEVRPTSVRGG